MALGGVFLNSIYLCYGNVDLNSSNVIDSFENEYDWTDFEADLYHWTKTLRPVQWYLGHIAKTERELKEQLKLMDVVIEVRDARIPLSTSHPQEVAERERVIDDPKAVVPAVFVLFRSRWGAAVCAQTQQTKNLTRWLTDWAPEPHDVYWNNLAIPFLELNVWKLIMGAAFFGLTFCFMFPIAFVQSLANIESIGKILLFLKPLINKGSVKSFIQGFLPGIVLKIFLLILPMILMEMFKVEGYTAVSALEARSAGKYHLFLLVNMFIGSIVTGTALQQLKEFLSQSASEIPKTVGVSIPMKATFFITYIMVDGWSGVAAEIFRMVPLILYYLKNVFLVKTEKDRGGNGSWFIGLANNRAPFTFVLLAWTCLLYCHSYTPIQNHILCFLLFRHQVINVYNQKYESAASFWPDVHRRIIINLLISHITLLGLLSTKQAANLTPFLLVLPVLTIWFHRFCKNRFESAFRKFPLQVRNN